MAESSFRASPIADQLRMGNSKSRNKVPIDKDTRKSKKNFFTLRGLGCTASPRVSLPAAIRSSADWHAKKAMKMKQKRVNPQQQADDDPSTSVPPRTDALVASVDCAVSRRSVSVRDKMNRIEPSLCNERPRTSPENMFFFDSDSVFRRLDNESDSDFLEARYHRHHFPGELAEIMLLMGGGRSNEYDRYKEWRLNVDNMSYEELLQLGERIGYVNAGLKEDEIEACLSVMNVLSVHLPTEMESKCSICQEEYEEEDVEMGKLDCGHFYHLHCIKKWLAQKNACPVCKSEAALK